MIILDRALERREAEGNPIRVGIVGAGYMKRIALGVAAVALGVLIVAPAQAATPRLVGTVGPGYKITLTKGGKKVTRLKAGRYTFVIADKASIHDFMAEP